MKVLLAIEGSPCSMEAVQAVALRPWPEGSKVKVVTVVEFPHIAGGGVRRTVLSGNSALPRGKDIFSC